ncbi:MULTISPECIES: xanthine dehydrogenase family protein molybdopterin-binding subunit [Alcaligenes]|uniref:xanthine dehydrogenase family protein molybdopterin-binding subunit n=1 Tax=Alcaligenes TaxID=507 RepID=UPI0003969C67|nr:MULTISPECIES: molybdopterin cofactor-binding domain-containing protein [Alcaligenes]ERI35014.1 hypothetical protein N879_05700 [Alcaligenes sp. EGD-AK7]HRO20858.1 molybdopterin-dependent oxidoreductase [Alcaligenes phenolicus]HRP13689.1 molybdopterin-dependent oxidoreductase [Alcaligenes phenolicus]
MSTAPFNRRQFLKFSVVSGVSIYMAPFIPKAAQATLLGEHDSRPTPWNSIERQVPFKIDGTRQVTGSKFFVRDIRAKDMPGWPEHQAHAFILRAAQADHRYIGLDLEALGADLQPDILIQAQDLAKAQLELPDYYNDEMLLATGKTARFLGHPVAILIYKDFDRYRRAKNASKRSAVLKYGDKTGFREIDAYGGARYIRVEGDTPGADDIFSSMKDGVVFPEKIQGNSPVWPSSKGNTNTAKAIALSEAMQERFDQPPNDWLVFDGEYYSQSIDGAPLEPECINCWYDNKNKELQMVVGSQTPGADGAEAAGIVAASQFGLENIIVHPCTATGYGVKEHSAFNHYGVVAALFTDNMPVRLANDRFEQFQAGQKRHSNRMNNRIAIDRKSGKIMQYQSFSITDGGGRATCSWAVTTGGAQSAQGIYYLPKSDSWGIALASRAVEAGSMRGYGKGQTMTAMELMLDEAAARLNMDPIELRLKNVMRSGQKNMEGGIPAGSLRAREILEKAHQHPLWTGRDKKKKEFEASNPGKLYGVGFACVMKNYGTGAQGDHSGIEIDEQGQVHLRTSTVEIGTGSATSQAVICAKWVGRAAHTVKASHLDWPELDMQATHNPYTLKQPDQDKHQTNPRWTPVLSSGSYASSSSYFGSHGTSEAARLLFLYGLWPAALSIWGEGYGGGQIAPLTVRPEDASWTDDGLLSTGGLEPLTLPQLAKRAHELELVTGVVLHAFNRYQWAEADFEVAGQNLRLPLDGLALRHGAGTKTEQAKARNGYQRLERRNISYPPVSRRRGGYLYYSAVGVLTEVEIDSKSGEQTLLSAHTWIDCGKPIVPQLVMSQAEGGLAMGLGQAWFEDLPLHEGGPGDGSWNFHRYRLPRAKDVAVWNTCFELLDQISETDSPKGIAEVVMIPIIAAAVSGVNHATGQFFRELPVTAEKIKERLA